MAVELSPHQFSICQEANGQFCNFITPFQVIVNLPSCITALYTKHAPSISTRCSSKIRKTQSVSIPSQLAPNVWILTTAPSAVPSTITLICLGETTKFITVKSQFRSCNYPQLPVLHHPTSIYPHIMKIQL